MKFVPDLETKMTRGHTAWDIHPPRSNGGRRSRKSSWRYRAPTTGHSRPHFDCIGIPRNYTKSEVTQSDFLRLYRHGLVGRSGAIDSSKARGFQGQKPSPNKTPPHRWISSREVCMATERSSQGAIRARLLPEACAKAPSGYAYASGSRELPILRLTDAGQAGK